MQTKINKKTILFVFIMTWCFIFLANCLAQGQSNKIRDENKIKALALSALEKWIKENPIDSDQIKGAEVIKIEKKNKTIHVILLKDSCVNNTEGMHKAYFHVYLSEKLKIIKVERGPDEVS